MGVKINVSYNKWRDTTGDLIYLAVEPSVSVIFYRNEVQSF